MIYDESAPLFRTLLNGLAPDERDRVVGEMRTNVAEQMAADIDGVLRGPRAER